MPSQYSHINCGEEYFDAYVCASAVRLNVLLEQKKMNAKNIKWTSKSVFVQLMQNALA